MEKVAIVRRNAHELFTSFLRFQRKTEKWPEIARNWREAGGGVCVCKTLRGGYNVNTVRRLRGFARVRVWHTRLKGGEFGRSLGEVVLGASMQKLKLGIGALVSFAVGQVGGYLFLAKIWTHLFTRPENVTATDFYLVVGLATLAGIVVATLSVKLLARKATAARPVHREAHA